MRLTRAVSESGYDGIIALLPEEIDIAKARQLFSICARNTRIFYAVPNLKDGVEIEKIGSNETLIRIQRDYNMQQTAALSEALLKKRVMCPIICSFEDRYIDFYMRKYAFAKIKFAGMEICSKSKYLLKKNVQYSSVCVAPEYKCFPEDMLDSVLFMEMNENLESPNRMKEIVSKVKRHTTKGKKAVLCLYDKQFIPYLSPVYMDEMNQNTRNNIMFASAGQNDILEYSTDNFDAIIIHFSLRLAFRVVSSSLREKLKSYPGLKILIIQDEYDTVCVTREEIYDLGIQVVISCVPPDSLNSVYPPEKLRSVEFYQALPGYIPESMLTNSHNVPIAERKIVLGYRGRMSPPFYGITGWEKYSIGIEMKKICEQKGIDCDISVREEDRIYGTEWFKFIEKCKAMLATESGCRVLDETGEIRMNVQKEMLRNPDFEFWRIYEKCVRQEDGKVSIITIGPKVFEAIALKTPLVMFEGDYGEVLQPDIHYIELKKDYSNINSVIERLEDNDYLQAMADRSYRDIAENPSFTYKGFMHEIDLLTDRMQSVMPMDKDIVEYYMTLENPMKDKKPQKLFKLKRWLQKTAPGLYFFLARIWKKIHCK